MLASLRAMPNLYVLPPGRRGRNRRGLAGGDRDGRARPRVLSLSRQNLPTVRTTHTDANLTAKGAYVLRDADGTRDVTLIATGSEVEIALAAADKLAEGGIRAAVVSAPCFEAFAAQAAGLPRRGARHARRGSASKPRSGMGWEALLGTDGAFVGMTGFGASAPADELYEHFGITADAVADAAKKLI